MDRLDKPQEGILRTCPDGTLTNDQAESDE